MRSLAAEIGINAMTVNRAYQLLKQEGYIVTERRNGARVSTLPEGSGQLSPQAEQTLERIISEAKIAGMSMESFLDICRKYFQEGEPL